MEEHKIKFSVITATYNAATVLPRLIASLQAQTDQDFEWVVADGASKDETLALLEEAGKVLDVRVDSRPDFGIYDALNRAIGLAKGSYYLVVGADDDLYPDAIAKYKQACRLSGADLVTAMIEVDGRVVAPRERRREWLYGMAAHISGHAVGVAIQRSLHDRFGFYTRKLPITADQLFVLTAVHSGASVHKCNFIAGRFSAEGTSGGDPFGMLLEYFRTQVLVGHSLWVQLMLLVLRLIRHPVIYNPMRDLNSNRM